MPAAAPKAEDESANVKKLLEDDIIDQRKELSGIYEMMYQKLGCECHAADNVYVMRDSGRLSKPLQRKLIELHEYMTTKTTNTPRFALSEYLIGRKIDPNTPYTKITEWFTDNNEALVKYTERNADFKKKLFKLLRSIFERVIASAVTLCDQFHNQVERLVALALFIGF